MDLVELGHRATGSSSCRLLAKRCELDLAVTRACWAPSWRSRSIRRRSRSAVATTRARDAAAPSRSRRASTRRRPARGSCAAPTERIVEHGRVGQGDDRDHRRHERDEEDHDARLEPPGQGVAETGDILQRTERGDAERGDEGRAEVTVELATRDVGHRRAPPGASSRGAGSAWRTGRSPSPPARSDSSATATARDDTVSSAGAQRSIAGRHDEPCSGNHRGEHQEVAGGDDEEVGSEQHRRRPRQWWRCRRRAARRADGRDPIYTSPPADGFDVDR